LFDYYAGFSSTFAKTVIESAADSRSFVVADPWNGSGTTTEIASILGYKTYGFDLNPVMVLIAKAKMLGRGERPSIVPLLLQIVAVTGGESVFENQPNDPLSRWLTDPAISSVRKLESAIQRVLVDAAGFQWLASRDIGSDVSDIAAFFYTALFRTLRVILANFLGSNPTWIKTAKSENDRIDLDLESVLASFEKQVREMATAIESDSYCRLQPDECFLNVASSEAIPLERGAADLILSSPPYCTRIDYAVATLPELALLGYSSTQFRELRDSLIGTSTISSKVPEQAHGWGATCNMFLDEMLLHESKASKSYYYKNHLQYFGAMYASVAEIKRVLAPDGLCVLVVQDSYYKEIHNDLPQIIVEMAVAHGLIAHRRVEFPNNRTLAGINRGVKQYRSRSTATESVLCLAHT
jgi:hypothetical protein